MNVSTNTQANTDYGYMNSSVAPEDYTRVFGNCLRRPDWRDPYLEPVSHDDARFSEDTVRARKLRAIIDKCPSVQILEGAFAPSTMSKELYKYVRCTKHKGPCTEIIEKIDRGYMRNPHIMTLGSVVIQ